MALAQYDYPGPDDNYIIARNSAGTSQMMVNGAYMSQQVLTITLKAKEAGVGQNPSYLNVRAPEAFSIPIFLVAEQE